MKDPNAKRAEICNTALQMLRLDHKQDLTQLSEIVGKVCAGMSHPVFAVGTPDSSLRANLEELDATLRDLYDLAGDLEQQWSNAVILLRRLSQGFKHDARISTKEDLRDHEALDEVLDVRPLSKDLRRVSHADEILRSSKYIGEGS